MAGRGLPQKPDAVRNSGDRAAKITAGSNPGHKPVSVDRKAAQIVLLEDHVFGLIVRAAGPECITQLFDGARIKPAVALGADRPGIGLPFLDQHLRSQEALDFACGKAAQRPARDRDPGAALTQPRPQPCQHRGPSRAHCAAPACGSPFQTASVGRRACPAASAAP